MHDEQRSVFQLWRFGAQCSINGSLATAPQLIRRLRFVRRAPTRRRLSNS